MGSTETSLDERIWDDSGLDAFPLAAVAVNLGLCELTALSVSKSFCPRVDDLGVTDNAM